MTSCGAVNSRPLEAAWFKAQILICGKLTSELSAGWKASIMLEELGVPYNLHSISLSKNEQKEEWFLKVHPNGRILFWMVQYMVDSFEWPNAMHAYCR